MTITLDPGHGRLANRGVYPDYYEGSAMFALAGFLKQELEKYSGVTVHITRKNINDDPTLAQRGKMAAENGSILFISLHSNAAGSPKACGVSLFRSVKSDKSEEFGHILADAVVALMNKTTNVTYKRGVMTRTYQQNGKTYDYYGVIRNSADAVPYTYIIEHGFHTNPTECAFLLEEENLRSIAKTEADVIGKYFSLSTMQTNEAPAEGDEVYTVKKGDTLSKIGRAYGVSWRTLAEYNGIDNPNLIFEGQRIYIPSDGFKQGDIVRLKDSVKTYYPNGNPFSKWVKNYDYEIMKTTDSKGKKVYRNGDECVLLGRRMDRKTKNFGDEIKSWCSINYIEKVK